MINFQRWRFWVSEVRASAAGFLARSDSLKAMFIILLVIGVLVMGWSAVYDYWVLGTDQRKAEHVYKKAEGLVEKESWDDALTALFEAEILYREANNVYGAADVEILKALVYAKKGDKVMTTYIMQRAKEAIQDRNDPLLEGYFYEHLLAMAMKHRQFSSIPSIADQTANVWLSQGKTKRAATFLVLTADQVLDSDGPKPMVIELYTRALFLYEQVGDVYNQAQCHERIGNVLVTVDAKAAVNAYQRAEGLFVQAQKPERAKTVQKSIKALQE
jgi:hypothetical protein